MRQSNRDTVYVSSPAFRRGRLVLRARPVMRPRAEEASPRPRRSTGRARKTNRPRQDGASGVVSARSVIFSVYFRRGIRLRG